MWGWFGHVRLVVFGWLYQIVGSSWSGLVRERYQKKNGLFSDIDHISSNTHPPPPKNDI